MRLLPHALVLLAASFLLPLTTLAQSFSAQECNRYAQNTATVLITTETNVTLGDGEPIEQGDQIALVTDEEQCAGVETWQGASTAIAISEFWSDSLGTTPGYEEGEKLSFRVWDGSRDSVYTVSATLESCDICETEESYSNDGVYLLSSLTVEAEGTDQEDDVILHPNYPNPVAGNTTIPVYLPESGEASLVVYNVLGQVVARVVDREMNAGSHEVQWNASALSSGTYVVKLTADGVIRTQTLQVVR